MNNPCNPTADELERRVKEHTAELEKANQALEAEVCACKRVEDELIKIKNRLEAELRDSRILQKPSPAPKSDTISSPAWKLVNLELAEIVDIRDIESLMHDFNKLTHIPIGLNDLKGNVLAGFGWQDICTRFHRVHPEACKQCVESDTKLSAIDVIHEEYKLYKCKHNMWDIATPINVGGRQIGIIFLGQFFFEDESLDYEFFRAQARKYGFNETEYIAALEKVPRLSRETVDTGVTFLTKLANMISQLSYSNIELSQALEERNILVEALRDSEKRERARSDELLIDIAERKRAEQEREITVSFLNLVNESKGKADLVRAAVCFFHERSGLDAVGIRLKEGGDYPYFETKGFPGKFVRMENSLCARDESGQLICDDAGNPALECMCGNVICTRFDPSKPFFTERGSFWTNSTTELLASTSDADLQARTRNRCNGEGYESVALIALRAGEQPLGLLQLNDRRKGQFSPRIIGMWERLADYLAVALAKTCAEENLHTAYRNLKVQSEELQSRSEELLETNHALRVSEEKYRIVANNTFDWEFWLDPDGRFLYTSPSCERVTGYAAQEFMDNPDLLQKIIHPDDLQEFLQHQHDTLPGRPGNIEFRIVTKDNEIKWIHHLCQPLCDNEGRYAGRRGSNRDITERKSVEETLAFERAQLLSIFDGIDDVVYVSDPYTYEVLYANKAMQEKFGGELVGGICYHEFQRRDRPCDFCTNQIILKEKGKPCHWEYYNPMVDRHFIIMDKIIKWPDGRDVRFEIAKDITDRKKAEVALRKIHDNLEKLVEERTAEVERAYNSLKESEKGLADAQRMAHIGNWNWNIVTGELFWSDEVYRIFRLKPQECKVSYDFFLNYVHPSDRDYLVNAVKQGLNGNPCAVEYRIVLADGEERIIFTEAENFLYEGNTPVKVKGIIQDITEQKRAEKELEKMNRIRIKEIHHRIKNNLQVISSLLDLQAEKFQHKEYIKDDEVLEAFQESQNRVLSMSLIHEELYKGEGTDKLDFSAYVQRLAENLLQAYGTNSKNIRLCIDLEENSFFDMDTAIPLGIIVNELISNSLKHAFNEGQIGEIGIRLSRDAQEEKSDGMHESVFSLTISDNGKGIPENIEIQNLESLGLQLVIALVDQLDGTIDIKREQGTEFIITFNAAEN